MHSDVENSAFNIKSLEILMSRLKYTFGENIHVHNVDIFV